MIPELLQKWIHVLSGILLAASEKTNEAQIRLGKAGNLSPGNGSRLSRMNVMDGRTEL